MYLIFTSLRILFDFCLMYTIYKIIWYIVVMIYFRTKIKKLNCKSVTVDFKRNLFGTIFGKKGITDFLLNTTKGTVAISLITFITVHSRWNIEKTKKNYYIEARKKNEWFYNNYVNSGDVPDHAREYKRETCFQRCLLHFPKETVDERIFLIIPKPKELTYTELKLEYLDNESIINGYKIMFANNFFELYSIKI